MKIFADIRKNHGRKKEIAKKIFFRGFFLAKKFEKVYDQFFQDAREDFFTIEFAPGRVNFDFQLCSIWKM